ncbi:hypothetical protein BOTNAR_0842g00020 [Botryotinia narcissicola]|uniref:Uncharacterized protein n=1 Tax=Botryotinia narcissicola TaxID=278944 RepID=A0A4Z1HH72_9HELO|nr:hypothetical protein BOTNAR_0842g00020 [Botryotinia narcissicola]
MVMKKPDSKFNEPVAIRPLSSAFFCAITTVLFALLDYYKPRQPSYSSEATSKKYTRKSRLLTLSDDSELYLEV